MSRNGPWTRNATAVGYMSRRLRVHQDQVVRPDGSTGEYDWVEAPDLVRVAAVVDGCVLLIEQHHYLVGRSLQLPGGSMDANETAQDAARRELREETGYRDGAWRDMGYVYPLPGLTPARVHLWHARDLTAGQATPEPFESDISVHRLTIADAVAAMRDGAIRCAASVALILAISGES